MEMQSSPSTNIKPESIKVSWKIKYACQQYYSIVFSPAKLIIWITCSDNTANDLNILRACHMNAIGVGALLWCCHHDIKSLNIHGLLKPDMHLLRILYLETMHFQILASLERYCL